MYDTGIAEELRDLLLHKGNKTRSKSHGGFDNDVRTMNSILSRILDRPPKRRFTEDDLNF